MLSAFSFKLQLNFIIRFIIHWFIFKFVSHYLFYFLKFMVAHDNIILHLKNLFFQIQNHF